MDSITIIENWNRDETSELAMEWAKEHAHSETEMDLLYDGFMAGFNEGFGLGVQETVNYITK